jgi:hypothetical protein
VVTRALLGEETHRPAEQQPSQFDASQIRLGVTVPQDAVAPNRKPTVKPRKREPEI